MAIFDFLKKIFGEIEEPKEPEKIPFNEVENWVKNKRKKISDKEEEIFILIKNNTTVFLNELKENVDVLENIDVESKKAEDRFKLIVRENLDNYVRHVENFIENLNKLKEEKFEKFIDSVDKIFLDFNKNTELNYQKATILIGKEMAVIKNGVKDFSKNLLKVFNENKTLIDSSKVISSIELKLKQINEINETLGRINEEIVTLDREINSNKEKEKIILDEIEKIKNSEERIIFLRKQKEVELDKKELERAIFKLRELIDFKALANFYHSFEKEMNIIKNYKKNFQTAFEKDSKSILTLLDESKLNDEKISNIVKEINGIQKKIDDASKSEDVLGNLFDEIHKIKLNINGLNDEKIKKLRRGEKIEKNKKGIIDLIKEEIVKVHVVLV